MLVLVLELVLVLLKEGQQPLVDAIARVGVRRGVGLLRHAQRLELPVGETESGRLVEDAMQDILAEALQRRRRVGAAGHARRHVLEVDDAVYVDAVVIFNFDGVPGCPDAHFGNAPVLEECPERTRDTPAGERAHLKDATALFVAKLNGRHFPRGDTRFKRDEPLDIEAQKGLTGGARREQRAALVNLLGASAIKNGSGEAKWL